MTYAVIFTSTRTLGDSDLYATWSARMEAEVAAIPGYLSHVGFRDAVTRRGVTISYFQSQEAIRTWRDVQEHREAQRLGRERFYEEYTVEVARIERSYAWKAEA